MYKPPQQVCSPYISRGDTTQRNSQPINSLISFDINTSIAVGLAYLAFDATCMSVTDVDFPLDMCVFDSARQRVRHHRFTAEMLATTRDWWQQRLRAALEELPRSWAVPLLRDSSPAEGLAERNL